MKFFLTCLKWSLKIGGPIFIWALASDFIASFLPEATRPIFNVASPLVGVMLCFVISFVIPSMRSYPMAAFGVVACYYAISTASMTWNWARAQTASGVPASSLMTADVLVGLAVCFGTMIGGAIGFIWAFPRLASLVRALSFAALLGNVHAGKTRRTDSNFYGSSDLLGKDAVRRLYDAGPGLVIGKFETGGWSKPLVVTYPLEGHVVIAAPTGTGKGTSVINLNLLTPGDNAWRGPVVILDPQGESVFIAGRHRESLRRKQILFDPTETIELKAGGNPEFFTPARAVCNPLAYIRRDENMVTDLDALLEGLCPIPANDKNSHFYVGARRIIGGVTAWVLTTMDPEYHTLEFVYRTVAQPHEKVEQLLKEMADHPDVAYGYPAKSAAFIMNVGANERGSHYATATNALSWLDNPKFSKQVSCTDPDQNVSLIDVLQNKADLYIVCPPAVLRKANPWVRMWFSTLLNMAQRMNDIPERVLMIIDEAPLVGRLEPVVEAFRVHRKTGISVMVITQTLPDLRSAYGKDDLESLLRNAEASWFFGISAADDSLPEMLEKLSATATWEVTSDSVNSGASGKATDLLSNNSQSAGTSTKLEKRAVLTASDIRQLNPDEVIFVNRGKTAKGMMKLKQLHYFEWPEAAERSGRNPYFRGKPSQKASTPDDGTAKKAA
jgi:type IV secretion system protein VirD4